MAIRLSDETKSQIRALIEQGKTQKDVAAQLDVSITAVKRWGYDPIAEDDTGSSETDEDALSVEDYYERILLAKDEHIESLERVIAQLLGKPIVGHDKLTPAIKL